jgi:hypothetical protein
MQSTIRVRVISLIARMLRMTVYINGIRRGSKDANDGPGDSM